MSQQVNLTLQGKGGVGKTLVSVLLAQHRIDNTDTKVVCVDTDPVNRSFTAFTGLEVLPIDFIQNNEIVPDAFDRLIGMVEKDKDAEFIIDNGATSFLPISSYMAENGGYAMLQELGAKTRINLIITGGGGLKDSITGFEELLKQIPKDVELVLWLNHYFGPITIDGGSFEASSLYTENHQQIEGIINLDKQSHLFESTMIKMFEAHKTFKEMDAGIDLTFMAKFRLKEIKKNLFSQMDYIYGIKTKSGEVEE